MEAKRRLGEDGGAGNVLNLKFVLLGAVGKTSFLQYYIEQTSSNDYVPTLGVDRRTKRIVYRGQEVSLSIWDTAGQERYNSLTKMYVRNAQGAILVFDLTDATSFELLEKYFALLRDNNNGRSQVIVVGNKSDRPNPQISEDALRQLCEDHQCPFYFCSAASGTGVVEVFDRLIELTLPDVLATSPASPTAATSDAKAAKTPLRAPREAPLRLTEDHDEGSSSSGCCLYAALPPLIWAATGARRGSDLWRPPVQFFLAIRPPSLNLSHVIFRDVWCRAAASPNSARISS